MAARDVLDPQRALTQPRADRLTADPEQAARILSAHETAMLQGASTYRDPMSGLLVLTAATLADRGVCCRGGCRHCPYLPANPT
jgi:hypothetical protein